jgi:hypothetical protein
VWVNLKVKVHMERMWSDCIRRICVRLLLGLTGWGENMEPSLTWRSVIKQPISGTSVVV